MALFTGTNFHKTFAIIIKFHLKLLCNNVTMYVLYVLPYFFGEHEHVLFEDFGTPTVTATMAPGKI